MKNILSMENEVDSVFNVTRMSNGWFEPETAVNLVFHLFFREFKRMPDYTS